jgi:hypothetical protein
VRTFSMLQGMFDLKVLLLAFNYFGIVVASLGILFFVPQIIKSIGVADARDQDCRPVSRRNNGQASDVHRVPPLNPAIPLPRPDAGRRVAAR